MNKVFLNGNLARDPEVRYTGSGKAVARFAIAVRRRTSRGSDSSQPGADFINVTVWDKQAEICGQYLQKGRRIGIEGHIRTNNYTDKDGQKHYGTDVVVDSFEFLDFKRSSAATPEIPGAVSVPNPNLAAVPESEIPF